MKEELTTKELAIIDEKVKAVTITKITYKQILNQDPPQAIVKFHKYGKFNYLPITAVERLLDGLFESWTCEILREGQTLNGFYTVVRLKAKIPKTSEYLVSDGIGFAEYQTTKGSSPIDFTNIIQGAGVLAIPRAKAEAIKNAAKSFGNLFGRNLTRNDDQASEESTFVGTSRSKIANTLGAINESN